MYLLEDVMNRLDEIERKLDYLTVRVVGKPYTPPMPVMEITDAEAAEVLRLSMHGSWELHHTVKPAQGTPVFGDDTREVPADPEYWHDGDFPVISSCVCGRQIIKMNPGSDWEYCGA